MNQTYDPPDKLAQSQIQRRFQDIVELASEGIVMVDAQAKITFANPRMHAMLGYPSGALEGCLASQFVTLGYMDTEATDSLVDQNLTPPNPVSKDLSKAASYRLIHHDGHTVDVLISAADIRNDDGSYAGAVATITDVTELRRTERTLYERSRQLAAVLANVDESVWRFHPDGDEFYISPTFYESLGYASTEYQATLEDWGRHLDPEDRNPLLTWLRSPGDGGLVQESTFRYQHRNCTWRWILARYKVTQRDANGRAIELTGTIVDITDRKQQELQLVNALREQRDLNQKLEDAQHQLLQSEKMASLGQLAAGVAHELNNPIGFIQSNMTTLERYLKDIFAITTAYHSAEDGEGIPAGVFQEVRRLKMDLDFNFIEEDISLLIRESMDGIERVTKIVRDLKNFSRLGDVNWQWADVHEGIESTLNIVRNEIKYKCQVTKHFAPLPKIYCIPSQLNQVTMNLLVNAAHAIPEHGDIIITTRLADSQSIQIVVADSGNGIPPELIKRIFEPFFTTKEIGKGTGLGLSIAYGIIARHHGRIEVESHLGRGTTFTITLPIRPPEAVGDPPPELFEPGACRG